MKTTALFLAILMGLLRPLPVHSQEASLPPDLFPSGLSVSTGYGRYAVRDEYLSSEKYTGRLPYNEFSWTRFRDGRGSRLSFGFRAAGDVRNHTLSSTVTGASLDLEFFHRLKGFDLFGKETSLYLGPSAGLSVYVNDQNVASNGLDLALSFASLISAGVTGGLVLPLTPRLSASATTRLDLVSLGVRIVDLVEDDESPVKVLHVGNGTFGTARIGLRYDKNRSLSLGLGYEGQFLRVSSWDYLGVASSNLVATVTLRGWKRGES